MSGRELQADEPLRHPRWMKVVALVCLVAAIALVIVGMIP